MDMITFDDRTSPARGEVWFVRGDRSNTVGAELWPNRDAVVLSPDDRNASGGFVVVAYIRRDLRTTPMHVGTAHGTVLTEQLHTIDASRLGRRVGCLTDEELARVDAAVATTIGVGRPDRPDQGRAGREEETNKKGLCHR